MHSAFEPLLTAADKMPFEVEPVYLKLSYYKPPAEAAPAPGSRSSCCDHSTGRQRRSSGCSDHGSGGYSNLPHRRKPEPSERVQTPTCIGLHALFN